MSHGHNNLKPANLLKLAINTDIQDPMCYSQVIKRMVMFRVLNISLKEIKKLQFQNQESENALWSLSHQNIKSPTILSFLTNRCFMFPRILKPLGKHFRWALLALKKRRERAGAIKDRSALEEKGALRSELWLSKHSSSNTTRPLGTTSTPHFHSEGILTQWVLFCPSTLDNSKKYP